MTFLEHDRKIILGGLSGMTVLAWGYMIHTAWGMQGTSPSDLISHPAAQSWTTYDLSAAFLMWTVMMIGMMLPSVAPWVLTLSRMTDDRDTSAGYLQPSALFLIGYLMVWTAYSGGAALLQMGLHEIALASSAAANTSSVAAALLLIIVGICQWTGLKNACLNHCRSPIGFFLTHWKDGHRGMLMMGAHHGLFCLGCCWALMLLSFVAGLMNLLWMALITIFIFADHTLASGSWPGKISGVLFMIWGCWLFL